jgi:allantoinase
VIADLVIRGGTLVTGDGERRAALAIGGGRIVAVDRDDAMPEAREAIDASGRHVLPGIIDTHVHLRDPGKIEREDWLTGTQAAAAGGITTILEMPLAIPPVHSAAILKDRAAHVGPRSIVDFALYAGANSDILDEIEPMAAAGAVAFKTFRTRPPKGREPEFVGITCPDAGQMLLAMERTARTGLLHVVHAEDQQILDVTESRARATGRHDGKVHAMSRPEIVETASVAQCIALGEATGARLQIAHMSAAAALDLVARAKADGVKVTAETCPHYLLFTDEALARWGPYAKCNPPLRPLESQQRLWEAVRSGVIDVIGTDHSPYTDKEKSDYMDNIWGATAGVPALEEFVPLMLTAASRGHLGLRVMTRVMSENPARLFGLWPRKGSLAAGSDADITICDTRVERVHDHRTLYTKSRDTALMYDGMRTVGAPVMTIVRGKIVMRDGRVTGEPGWGQWVRPH